MVATTTNPLAEAGQVKKPAVPAVGGSMFRPLNQQPGFGAKPNQGFSGFANGAKTMVSGGGTVGGGAVAAVGGLLRPPTPMRPQIDASDRTTTPGGVTGTGAPPRTPAEWTAHASDPVTSHATSSPGVPGNVSRFGPSGDLRGSQILPGGDPRLGATQGQVDTARNALATGPDRFQIAKDRYGQFLQDSAPGDFDAIRAVRQAAGAGGTLGSGMQAKGFADLGARIEQARGSARNTFLGNALEGTIADRRNNLSDLSGLESQQFGQGLTGRNEFRTERGYQGDVAQRSLDNRRQQQLDEEYLTNGQFNRDETRANDLASIGFRDNPSSAILTGASGQQGAADQNGDSLAELLRQYAFRRSQGGGGSPYPAGYGGDATPADTLTPTTRQQPYQLPLRY